MEKGERDSKTNTREAHISLSLLIARKNNNIKNTMATPSKLAALVQSVLTFIPDVYTMHV